MKYPEVAAHFRNDLVQVEQALRDHYRTEISIVPEIGDYIMSAGGKRIRPLLLLLSSRLCGLPLDEKVIKHCCVVEYVHAASLLHDDVVDETTLRRGRQTVNSKWGSDASILVGDYLISRSILLLADDVDQKIFKTFSEAAKVLVEGGLLEYCNARDILITEELCQKIIYGKTASIMELSCQLGAQLAKSETIEEKALADFGKNLGMAFQVIDDLLDYDGDPELLGKPVGTDFKEGHVTLPLLYLYQKAEKSLKREIEAFIDNENIIQKDYEYITEKMREYRIFEQVFEKACIHINNAKSSLSGKNFAEPKYIEFLTAVADFVINNYLSNRPSLTPTP